MLGLLIANDRIWPAYFYYSEKGNRFILNMPVRNTNITPVVLKQYIENYFRAFNDYEKFWNPKKWD
jgi:hypothetical protein